MSWLFVSSGRHGSPIQRFRFSVFSLCNWLTRVFIILFLLANRYRRQLYFSRNPYKDLKFLIALLLIVRKKKKKKAYTKKKILYRTNRSTSAFTPPNSIKLFTISFSFAQWREVWQCQYTKTEEIKYFYFHGTIKRKECTILIKFRDNYTQTYLLVGKISCPHWCHQDFRGILSKFRLSCGCFLIDFLIDFFINSA